MNSEMPPKNALWAATQKFGRGFSTRQKESTVLEEHLQPDHVHMLISIASNDSMVQVVGYMKGKRAIPIALTYLERRNNHKGMHFWVRGYFVSTVGADEGVVRCDVIFI